MAVLIGSARIDENGHAHGGKAGDQTGREVCTQTWYKHSRGWRVFRAKDRAVAEKIAHCMRAACNNDRIGYDQYQRNTLYNVVRPYGFDVSKVHTATETDCSALVRVCCAYAGVSLPDFNTVSEAAALLKSGAFTELTGSKYADQDLYLGRGDILVTRTKGHTVVALTDGSRYEGSVYKRDYALGDRIISYGMEGADVKAMQEMLIELGYDLGSWGADGDFGDCTELALGSFQRDWGLDVDGECGPVTLDALNDAFDALEAMRTADGRKVRIEGGDCFIRSAPNTAGRKLGVACRGEILPYGGEISPGGWLLVEHEGQNGWVSGMYGKLVS